jgi:hypothetical protein
MARSRNIKPGFFTNEDLVELDFATRLLFAGLWTVADKEGRLQDRPKKIKIDVFPADNLDIDAMLQALADRKFITRYEVNGGKFIQIANWTKHQNPHHTEKASEIPGIDGELTVKPPLEPRESQKQDGGNLADSLIPDSLIPDSLQEKQPTVVGAERAPSQRGTRLPKDWELPAEWMDWSLAEHPHWGPQTVQGIAAKFGRYWRAKAGKDATKLDWLATWQNWCTSDITQREHPPPSGPTETTYQRSMRERMEQVAPAVAAKRPGSVPTMNPMDVLDGLTRISG